MDDLIQLLTDPENQPHQYLDSPKELRQRISALITLAADEKYRALVFSHAKLIERVRAGTVTEDLLEDSEKSLAQLNGDERE